LGCRCSLNGKGLSTTFFKKLEGKSLLGPHTPCMGLLENFPEGLLNFLELRGMNSSILKSLLYLSLKAQTELTADFKSKTKALKAAHNQPFPIFPVIPFEFRFFQSTLL